MFAGSRIVFSRTNVIVTRYHIRPLISNLPKVNFLLKAQSAISISCVHNLVSNKSMPLTKEPVSPVNRYVQRTHTCGELTLKNVGEEVKLSGWLEFQRMKKFITLRDSYGSTQLLIPEDRKDLIATIQNLSFESVLSTIGKVVPRPENQQNKKMKTGDIEIYVESLEVLNAASQNPPVFIREYSKAKESQQMKYRYLSLRYPELQKNLRMRSSLIMRMREFLIHECSFVDIETPTLFKSTPGGAQEFVVPTRQPGNFYSLVQSPQQFKQLLMVGGLDRYFQIARCYRDETVRHDRQPEFTQLDIEMSFVDRDGVMSLIENLLIYSWPEELGSIKMPFKLITYKDAMELYGTDKPDLRISYQIQDLTHMFDLPGLKETMKLKDEQKVYALVFPKKAKYLTKSIRDELSKIRSNYFATKLVQLKIESNSWKTQLDKLKLKSGIVTKDVSQYCKLQEGDAVLLAIGHRMDALKLLGKLRTEFTNILEAKGEQIRSSEAELVWITDFPLFTFEETLESSHHPFTQPHPEDMEYLTTDPLKVRGLHYDLVMNGSEIAGGSIRIHDANLQKQILGMLNIDETKLSHMLEALTYGAPPHGGIAIGLDRFICVLCNEKSIKNVIAFPKTMEGRDLMSGAPDIISDELKILYHIQTVDK
ncbi:Aspartyl-tRNA synthetase, mitochondrial [Atta colombica]|uniref:Aspartyl-tRNA synthetase, mitochondrial n=1 Tax=Atta colombica TaxID=520822 RepID=A0A195BX70_9HYME|nr:PREDICTED: aspartate--tRNA ligase, mitochondrial [Atta colombica]KYM92890.1 Aspartyl-tRNA synthetase, mitochondrial [Atta colombica]